MRREMRAKIVACCVLATAFIGGCASDPTQGYSTSSIYPSGVSTVAVPIFTSESYTRNVEFELTDALIKEIEARTPYNVVPADRADTVLLGQIKAIELDQLSKSRLTGLSEEVIVSVTIDFQWKDQRSGKPMVERRGFAGHALFVPSAPSSEAIELGQFSVVQQLARDIVAELQSEW
jgi:hypothetical protein